MTDTTRPPNWQDIMTEMHDREQALMAALHEVTNKLQIANLLLAAAYSAKREVTE